MFVIIIAMTSIIIIIIIEIVLIIIMQFCKVLKYMAYLFKYAFKNVAYVQETLIVRSRERVGPFVLCPMPPFKVKSPQWKIKYFL